MISNRPAAPHLLRSLALRSLSCHRPGPHTGCIAVRPLSRIYGTTERLQFWGSRKFCVSGERLS